MNQALITNPFLTAEQLAANLGVRPDTIRDWGRRGLIPRIKLSHKIVRYDLEDVVAVLLKKRESDRETAPQLEPTESQNKECPL